MTDYLDEVLFEDQILEMLYYNKIDISERTDFVKSNNSKECIICHYWFFNNGFNFKFMYVWLSRFDNVKY